MPKIKRCKTTTLVPYVRGFKLPTEKMQLQALDFSLKENIPRHLVPDKESFKPIPRCTSEDDWLAQYKEPGQTYRQFMAECPWLSTRQRKCMYQQFCPHGKNLPEKYPDCAIYILPIGDFTKDTCPQIDALMKFTSIFYNIPVKLLSGIELEQENNMVFWKETSNTTLKGVKTRRMKLKSRFDEDSGHIQLCVDGGLMKLKRVIPNDAICAIALSSYDLYADEPDLFVAGMAAGAYKVGIFSLFRYDPNLSFSPEFWYSVKHNSKCKQKERSRLILLRSCRLLVHEIAHLLGIAHCVHYACCMNGSGHLQEDFRQPLFLCPVDLRKLQTLCGFDIIERYTKMKDFFKKYELNEEKTWVENRIKMISQ